MHTPPAHRLSRQSAGPGLPGLPGTFGMFGPLCLFCLLMGLCKPAGSAQPGPLPDPTRPPGAAPANAATSAGASAGNRPGRQGSARPDSATNPPAAASVALSSVLLQAIQTSNLHPPSAMVDGQLVKVGDSVAGRSVLAIDSQGLLLRGPAGHERLWLLTDSPKQTAGSITTTRSAAYQPAPRAPDDADAVQRADRSNTTPNTATPAGNAAALSLVGRTTP